MSNFKTTIDGLQATIDKARTTARHAFMDELKQIFKKHPELKVMKWSQYTPYFNDGDSCTFTVHDAYVCNYEGISTWGEWEGTDEDGNTMAEPHDLNVCYLGGSTGAKAFPELHELNTFMQSQLGNDVLEEEFGDHVEVCVTRTGIVITEVDHD